MPAVELACQLAIIVAKIDKLVKLLAILEFTQVPKAAQHSSRIIMQHIFDLKG